MMTREQLMDAYILIQVFEGVNSEAAKKFLKQEKARVREYNKQKSNERFIKDDYDGYLVKILTGIKPQEKTLEEMEAYFDGSLRLEYVPSQYDCTGQSFTIYHKIGVQNGQWVIYHRVGYDV